MFRIGPYIIKVVDDNFTKTHFDPNFVEGANSKAKKYVPDFEIWISSAIKPEFRGYIILHEIIEDMRMRYKGESYLQAHNEANKMETEVRENV
jgi:hypothetical protein